VLILFPNLQVMTRKKIVRKFVIPAIVFLLSWLLAVAFSGMNNRKTDVSKLKLSIQEHFWAGEKQLDAAVKYFVTQSETETDFLSVYQSYYEKHKELNEFGFYVFVNDSLNFWSNENIPVQDLESQLQFFDKKLIRLPNGYYYCVTGEQEHLKVAGLMPVYYVFPYQNQFLKNGFASFFQLNFPATLLSSDTDAGGIKNSEENIIFGVELPGGNTQNNIPFSFIFVAFLTAICSVILIARNLLTLTRFKHSLQFVLLTIFLLLIRYLQITYFFPVFIYEDPLFSPVFYAWNKWFASLGDLMTNVFIFFIISMLVWSHYRNSIRYFRKRWKRLSFTFILTLLLLFVFLLMNVLLETLIINSTLLLSFDGILRLKQHDFYGFSVIIVMMLAFMYLSHPLLLIIRKNIRFRREIIIYSSFTALIAVLVLFLFPGQWIQIIIFMLFLLIVISLSVKYSGISGAFSILCVFLFALSFGRVVNRFNTEKELSYRSLYAIQLSNEQDPIGEYLFEDIAKQIRTDSIFALNLSGFESSSSAEEYLRRKYLSGYFTKYHIQVTLCRPKDILLLVSSNTEAPCAMFFESLKMQFGTPTMVPDYWLIDDETGRPNYLFETMLVSKQNEIPDTFMLFLELVSIPKISGLGYPELLVEEKVMKRPARFDYAYAKYFNNELISQYGDYYYPLTLDGSMKVTEQTFFSVDNYFHLIYPVNPRTTIVVSLPVKSNFEKAATFSYFLILFAVFHFVFLIVLSVFQKMPLLPLFAFKTRLQTASIFLVILSFVVAGIITVNFFIRYHNNKNREIIREKSFSLLVELEHKLRTYDHLGLEDANYLSDLMTKFSNVFFTDINLFSTTGQLIGTSRPQIYQQGLTSTFINPFALKKLKGSGTQYFLQNESIGNLNYTSSYLPFKNYRNEVIAYLSLPYFARENELRKEISSFLTTFMNFYVVLIALAIIIALVVANYITLPLRLIGEKLRALKPGQPNEKIRWSKQDDIGILVGEYNRMVDQLADSTRLLMKSERESAWREMAKQIAHEIKNPLTPMKLSLQNLQRAWNDKAPDYEERMKRTSQTLIEQIEALSSIATEFSNFARLQETKQNPVNIVPVIRDAIHLYQSDCIRIEFVYDELQSFIILGEETQLIQILNNLLKNAVQSIPAKEAGEIEVKAEKTSGKIYLRVKDNGCGIPEEIRDKIFSPNFTSKSGGTGLGLAISKKIINHFGGTISFESEMNKGTIFTLCFSEYINNTE
jgi:two-component system, NtrC family, nitrogen regulation sensor histidine kinase NtrY